MTSIIFIWLDIPIKNNAANNTIEKKRKKIFMGFKKFKTILF